MLYNVNMKIYVPLYTESHIASYKNIVYSIVVKFDILSLNIFPVQIRLLLSYIIEIYQNNDIIFLREARFRNEEFVLLKIIVGVGVSTIPNRFLSFFTKIFFHVLLLPSRCQPALT